MRLSNIHTTHPWAQDNFWILLCIATVTDSNQLVESGNVQLNRAHERNKKSILGRHWVSMVIAFAGVLLVSMDYLAS